MYNHNKFDLKALRRAQVAGKFANFYGEPGADPESPFLQRKKGFAGMSGSGVQQVQGPLTELSILIQNTDPNNDLIVSLFNANKLLSDAFNGTADVAGTVAGVGVGLIVTVGDDTHAQFKARTQSQKHLVEGIRIFYPTATQAAQQWSLMTFNNNVQSIRNYNPKMHLTAGQQQSNQVDHANFSAIIDGDNRWQFKVFRAPAAGTPNEISIFLNVRALENGVQLLNGQSPLGVNAGQALGGNNLY